MKIFKVVVQIYPPKDDGYPGQVEEGFYSFEDGEVTLVTHAGLPLYDRRGKPLSKKLSAGEDVHQNAGRLLRTYYESKKKGSRFNRPLIYPKSSIV